MTVADFFQLALKGLIVASLPLGLVWAMRGADRPARFRRLAWMTVFFTFDLIVFGGFTRLTDSGLGCPDWPGCYARANPFAAATDIHAAEAAMPSGPVTMGKAWIEMIHRYLAMGVGVLIIVMLAWSVRDWLVARRARPARASMRAPWLPAALLGLVCLQGAFGAWTVTLKLQPVIVTTHLLLAMALLALLAWHAARSDEAGVAALPAAVGGKLRVLAIMSAVLLAVQIALGGWVSTNYAVLACNQFPLCQGVLVPDMDFSNGFHLWRELGKTADNGYLPFAALTAIHWTHRGVAMLVFVVLGALAWRARRVPALRSLATRLAWLLVAQFCTGVVNVVFDWPLLAAVLHNAGAAALVLVLVMLNYRIAQAVCDPLASRPSGRTSNPVPSKGPHATGPHATSS